MDAIQFYATLKERGAARFDRDGAAVVQLETSADQLPAVMQLAAMSGDQLLRITVERAG